MLHDYKGQNFISHQHSPRMESNVLIYLMLRVTAFFCSCSFVAPLAGISWWHLSCPHSYVGGERLSFHRCGCWCSWWSCSSRLQNKHRLVSSSKNPNRMAKKEGWARKALPAALPPGIRGAREDQESWWQRFLC